MAESKPISARAKIEELSDERASGGAWFVYLQPGWQTGGAHCFGADSMAEVWRIMRTVQPCNCRDCAAAGEAAA